MRTVRFTFNAPSSYENVPIPDDVEDQDIFDYLIEHIDEFDRYKNTDTDIYGPESINMCYVEDEDGNEIELYNENI